MRLPGDFCSTIFIDDAYLIKGIAGRILWKLLQSYAERERVDFTNKEIRLDTSLRLPDIKDNLEARLILLRRRLQDRCDFVSLNPVGRGQFVWTYSANSRWRSGCRQGRQTKTLLWPVV